MTLDLEGRVIRIERALRERLLIDLTEFGTPEEIAAAEQAAADEAQLDIEQRQATAEAAHAERVKAADAELAARPLVG